MRRVTTSKVAKPEGARVASPEGGTSLDVGRRVLDIEARAVQALVQRLDGGFSQAVDLLYHCKGKVVVSGMGKSGLIGQKIAATMASTGTPSFFLHPAEGLHGDLGMLARRDVLIAISNSGETQEILQLLPFMDRMAIPVVAIVGRMGSALAKNSAVALDVSVAEEACPMGLAPTASTTATLAMGDALAVALLEKRGFKEHDFAQFHPGGTLGRRLLVKVRDVMHVGEELPQVQETVSASVALLEMSAKKLGMTTVVDRAGTLLGVITDGDLRRMLEKNIHIDKIKADDIMSKSAKTIGPDEMAVDALDVLRKNEISQLVVTDAGKYLGIIHLHDLIREGLI